ncbi:MAG: hypothetical protein KatS3mg121_0488 [Gammaproteobacteria bacterium]|nr:MAG: hypothetical protein KatS3mg121_0488 [Gammaproteobacteria bacterium]
MERGRPRRVLLAVSGMSPQVITETLYALVLEKNWVPDEIRLITTTQGRDNAVGWLLEGPAHLRRFLEDYRIDHPIRFDERSIILIEDAQGRPLDDLRTPEDNEAAADVICRVIREFTQDPDTELHVSLAGGRKTMGFYAGYALSLFGRPQDCLSHVLVSAEHESLPDFFYPTPTSRIIRNQAGQEIDTHRATVWLAEIPFVRLRSHLPPPLLSGAHSFSQTVALARKSTEARPELILYPAERRYRIDDVEGKIGAAGMAVLLWLAHRRRSGQGPIQPIIENDDRSEDLNTLLALARDHGVDLAPKTLHMLHKEGLTQAWLEQTVSRINRTFLETLGADLSDRCRIASRPSGRPRGYDFPPDLVVRVVEDDWPGKLASPCVRPDWP